MISVPEKTMKMRPTPDSRKRIRPDEKLQFTLDGGERELILQHTFADDDLTRSCVSCPVQASWLRIVSLGASWMIWPAS